MASGGAAGPVPRDPPEVRRRRPRSVFVRHDDRRRLHRSRNRCGLQADGSARSQAVLHEPDSRRNGSSHGASRREVRDQSGLPHAQPGQRSERSCVTGESRKLLGMSKLFMVNLDIGHYARGGNDPFAYIKAHHDRITHLHIRDHEDGTAAPQTSARVICRSPTSCARFATTGGRLPAFSNRANRLRIDGEATRANLDVMRKALES